MIYFTAHTFKCVCHCIRTMFRVLGVYNFGPRASFSGGDIPNKTQLTLGRVLAAAKVIYTKYYKNRNNSDLKKICNFSN